MMTTLITGMAMNMKDDKTKTASSAIETHSSAMWEWGAQNSQELIENSTIIGEGTVIDSYTRPIADLVFTYNIVRFDNIHMLSSDFADSMVSNEKVSQKNGNLTIEVLQTGGAYEDMYTQPFDEAPLYEKGKSYFFFLKDAPEGYYLPVGGFQGNANIEKGLISFDSLPDGNKFSDLEVKMNTFASKLQKFALDQEQYFINASNQASTMFFEKSLSETGFVSEPNGNVVYKENVMLEKSAVPEENSMSEESTTPEENAVPKENVTPGQIVAPVSTQTFID